MDKNGKKGYLMWRCLKGQEQSVQKPPLGNTVEVGRSCKQDAWWLTTESCVLGELKFGNRNSGAPKLRYIDGLKWHLKNAGIDVHTWEDIAQDRSCWHGIISKSLIAIEERHLQRYNIVHDKRHSQLVTSDFICSRCHWACCCKAGLTLHSQVSFFHDTDAHKPVIIENNGLSIF